MAQLPKYYIVEAQALPEVFLKVAEAKWLLETGEVATVNDAARATGISRSAFYKYRDSISPFQNLMAGRILTFQLLLRDMTGLLSSILTIFAQFGANILTINQAIPTNGCASVTISAETSGISQGVEALMRALSQVDGVRKRPIRSVKFCRIPCACLLHFPVRACILVAGNSQGGGVIHGF